MVGIANYKTGTKNNWRRRVWNEVSSRIDDKRSSKVIYLAGAQDLDRAVAVSKGFSASNMVAVDSERSVVESLRKCGKVAMQSRLSEAVAAFGGADVVLADFCCGLTSEVFKTAISAILLADTSKDFVLVANLQRGREHKDEIYDESSALDEDILHCAKETDSELLLSQVLPELMKHRGAKLYRLLISVLMRELASNPANGGALHFMHENANPELMTYRSSANKALKFDTLIISNPLRGCKIGAELRKAVIKDIGGSAARKSAAAKAVMTMRLSGGMKRQPQW
jgi:hypothetical protein